MKLLKLSGLAVGLAAASAQATLFTYDFNGINAGVPDGNPSGYANSQNVNLGLTPANGPSADGTTTEIVDVNVRINISGGYNGDLYGYLVHSSGFSVLLNRVGRTGSDPFGYGDAGMVVTFDDSASGDIHTYGAGTITGGASWQVDGRTADPSTVTDASTRNAPLSNFNGLNANGTWTLFLADMSGGEISTLMSWGLDIEVVPEPTTYALIGFGVVFAGVSLWRMRKQRQTATAS